MCSLVECQQLARSCGCRNKKMKELPGAGLVEGYIRERQNVCAQHFEQVEISVVRLGNLLLESYSQCNTYFMCVI